MVLAMTDSKTKSLYVVFYKLGDDDEWVRVNFLVEETDRNFPAEFSLALSGTRALLGIPYADPEDSGDYHNSIVFIYEQGDRRLWEKVGDPLLPSGPYHSGFGHFVDIDGDLAVVGTHHVIGINDESVYIFRRDRNMWTLIGKIGLPSVEDVLVAGNTIAVSSGEHIHLYNYNEALDAVEPLQEQLGKSILTLDLSRDYLIYSTRSSRNIETFVYYRQPTNQTFALRQQLRPSTYDNGFGRSLVFEKDILVVAGKSKTFILSLQNGNWEEFGILDTAHDRYQISDRNLLAIDMNGEFYSFNLEDCAPMSTQAPSLSMAPTASHSLVPSASANPSEPPSLSIIPSESPSASQVPTSLSPVLIPPSAMPSSMPTSIRLSEVIKLLTPLSGELLKVKGSPQYKAAMWIANEDPIPNISTGGMGLDLDDPRFEQRYIMALFYFAMDGENWQQNQGWMSSQSECLWYGVKGNSDGCPEGCIKKSDLDYDMICRIGMGFDNNLYGEIPSELGYLSEMRWFEIQDDYLFGTIPSTLGTGWTKLHTFLVSGNSLSGGFPRTFESNKMLGTIFMGHNQFGGTFPNVFTTLKNLKWLDVEDNGFVGDLPTEMGELKALRILNIINNNMTGNIPDTWDEKNLIEDFEISDNNFIGSLPANLGKAKFLKDFHASRNQLTGSIPASYFTLEYLQELYLDENNMVGGLPQTDEPFYNGLQELSIHSNSFSGHFPVKYFENTLRISEVLSLHNNDLMGSITENICARLDPSLGYTRLNELTADCGKISCECCICYEYGKVVSEPSPRSPSPVVASGPTTTPTAESYESTDQDEANWQARPTRAPNSLVQNRDTLGIQEMIEKTVLQRFASFDGMGKNDVRYQALDWILFNDGRQLTTDDDSLSQRYILALLAFSLDSLAWHHCGEHRVFTQVTKEFVAEDCEVWNIVMGQYEKHNVWLTSVDECHWYGVICSGDGVVRGLELMGNDLIGQIPPEISQLVLQYLVLAGNCLYGTIPPEIGTMPYLISLELQGNGLSGEIPSELYDASKLHQLNVAMQYGYSSVCTMSNGTTVNTMYEQGGVYSRKYNPGLWGNILEANVNKWMNMVGLHIFDNSFSGTISDEIGDLKYLEYLRAQNNVFRGYIPNGFQKLKELREAYLQNNELYSDIPPNIGDLENLEDLRLHENEMYGPIPDSLYTLRKLKKLWLHDTMSCKYVDGWCESTMIDSDFGFSGTISTKIGNLSKLSQLLISNNPLTGTLPTELGLCEDLSLLRVHKTNIGGSVPKEVCLLRDKKLDRSQWQKYVGVGIFYADCRPNNNTQEPFIHCGCCSDCCDHTTKVCIADD